MGKVEVGTRDRKNNWLPLTGALMHILETLALYGVPEVLERLLVVDGL